MGLKVFTPGNLILCWVAMLIQTLLIFATEDSARRSKLVKGDYTNFAQDFCTDTYATNLIRGVFPIAVDKHQPANCTVRSLASLDQNLRGRLTFLHAVRCHAPC